VAAWDTRNGTQLWFLNEGDENRGDSPKWQSGVCRASLEFSANGRYFLTLLEGVAKLRRSANQQVVMTVASTADRAYCSAALSPDGQQLALGTEDGEIEIWDTAHARRLSHAKAHRQASVSLAFDPGGHRMASGGLESVDQDGGAQDSSVKVWDLDALAPLLVLEDHADRVWHPLGPDVFNPTGNDAHDFESDLGHRVIFSRDGKLLAVDSSIAGHEDVYSLKSDELLRLARTRLSSPLPLSSGECQTYLHEEQCPKP
jgi:WD40 repeat protein